MPVLLITKESLKIKVGKRHPTNAKIKKKKQNSSYNTDIKQETCFRQKSIKR